MSDNLVILLFVVGILVLLILIAIIGLIIYGIIVWRRRASDSESAADTNTDPGIGTVRRLYFYVVAFVSLMMTATGVLFLVQVILDSIFGGDVISGSTIRLAGGMALVIVGSPLWYFHWRYIQRAVAEQPVETRSILRKLYIYITLAVAGSIAIYTAYDLLNWIFGTEDFSGYSIAAVIIWSGVWAFHWLIEEREGQPTSETIVVRRLYIYIASLVGLIMLSLGVGRVLYFILLEGYNSLTATPLLGDESGLWRPTLREMLSLAIIGGGVWALHWLYIARRDYDSAIRQVYLYIFAILGGVMTTLSALGIIIDEILVWALGSVSADSTAEHFEFLPGSVATLSVGAALWAYHWYRVRLEADMSPSNNSVGPPRIHLHSHGNRNRHARRRNIHARRRGAQAHSGELRRCCRWRRPVEAPLANIITLAVLGGPLWGYYWRNIQLRMQADSDDEILATSRRIFIFAALGVGVLALLGSVSALLFMFLRDLLEVSLSLGTLGDMVEPIAIIAAAAAFLPYYWTVYRQDQDAAPEIMLEDSPVISDPVEGQPPRKPVTLLAADDANALVGQIQDALGYDIETLRWADTDVVMPALTDEACAQVAQSIADAPGRYILLIPDGEQLRVLSHD